MGIDPPIEGRCLGYFRKSRDSPCSSRSANPAGICISRDVEIRDPDSPISCVKGDCFGLAEVKSTSSFEKMASFRDRQIFLGKHFLDCVDSIYYCMSVPRCSFLSE